MCEPERVFLCGCRYLFVGAWDADANNVPVRKRYGSGGEVRFDLGELPTRTFKWHPTDFCVNHTVIRSERRDVALEKDIFDMSIPACRHACLHDPTKHDLTMKIDSE